MEKHADIPKRILSLGYIEKSYDVINITSIDLVQIHLHMDKHTLLYAFY